MTDIQYEHISMGIAWLAGLSYLNTIGILILLFRTGKKTP